MTETGCTQYLHLLFFSSHTGHSPVAAEAAAEADPALVLSPPTQPGLFLDQTVIRVINEHRGVARLAFRLVRMRTGADYELVALDAAFEESARAPNHEASSGMSRSVSIILPYKL